MKKLLQKFQQELSQLNQSSNGDCIESKFAIKRFWKKFQIPLEGNDHALHTEAWDTFLSTDLGLNLPNRVDGLWYKVREDLHSLNYRLPEDVDFPKGSEFIATRGANSLEARLAKSTWTVTPDCFDAFSKIVYSHKALKRAFRERYNRWYQSQNFDMSRSSSEFFLWNRLKNPFDIFKWKLARVCQFEHGSRFSTVPKNNTNRRPINIECFGNMIVQKRIGDCFRGLVKSHYGNDLSILQDDHKRRLADSRISTIDLKNASDSINLDLVKFLFPKSIFKLICKARSEMILGPDGYYHQLKKVSSMGNGFTFELMTLILTSLCRVLDSNSSVYGDDIIIDSSVASRLIQALEDVGFQVNREKSFINSSFRESCGGNFHDDVGYIESYDFTWPENIHDCITFYNKAQALSKYSFFKDIVTRLDKVIPPALRGPLSGFYKPMGLEVSNNRSDALGGFFRQGDTNSLKKFSKTRVEIATRYHYDIDSVVIHYGFRFTPSLRTPLLKELIRRRHWAKYEMYLASGMVTKDTLSSTGRWDSIVLCTIEGRTSTLASLLS